MADVHAAVVRVQDVEATTTQNEAGSQERTFALLLALGVACIFPQLTRLVPLDWLAGVLPVHGMAPGVEQQIHARVWGLALELPAVALLYLVYLSGERQFAARFCIRPIHLSGALVAAIVPMVYLLSYYGLPRALPPSTDPQFLIWQTSFAALAALSSVVIDPISEELLFRGFLFRALSKTFLGPVYAALLSSLAFGLGHVDKSPTGQLVCFIHGLVLCYVVQRTKTAVYGIIAHSVFNGYLVLLTLVAAMAH